MSNDKKEKFDCWYNEEKNKIFILKNEIEKYCWSDVQLLTKGVLAFRKIWLNISEIDKESSFQPGFDPFTLTITLASLCAKLFRRNFLKEDTIAVIDEFSNPKDMSSKKCEFYIEYESRKRGINIRSARNGGEIHIGKYKVDGFYESHDGLILVFEFHG